MLRFSVIAKEADNVAVNNELLPELAAHHTYMLTRFLPLGIKYVDNVLD